ncbi:hypothetical protein M422DRAFT_254396 [Sphaerobolus stellatus SS14]|uniref:Unplaced genomic scaffold SPHSTscaffold_55, whole genome shotgun sequence n=1 Tax=Sphaerobolus stellatus (strain SS14) TaxID=990650 RepID=A0A0C9UH01_SPHS4|nr:hypothetical protein M422DRAFT_254396 [Sphaerobolus stellatus SS14]
MDAWLIPMWGSKRKVWVLGALDLCQRRYWYVDSQPTFSRDPAAQGQEWVWQYDNPVFRSSEDNRELEWCDCHAFKSGNNGSRLRHIGSSRH